MQQDKTKILSDLYAIRATMSLVAENDENNAEPERQAIKTCEREQRETQTAISDSEKALASALYQKKKSAQARMEELRKVQAEKEKCYIGRQEIVNNSFASDFWDTLWDHWNVGHLLGVILVILIIASIPLSVSLGGLWKLGFSIAGLDKYGSGVLITGSICLSIICIYIFGICIPVTIHDRKRRRLRLPISEAELKQANRELTVATEIYEAFDERVGDIAYSWETPVCKKVTAPKHYNAEINTLVQTHEEEVAAMEHKREELEQQKEPHRELLKANAEKVSAIVESATKAYPLIDFRDWENVDLLIYYFETGRADDMKEALQLVDRQRQTEMLAKAIAMASAEIRKTIHQSMERLGGALSQSFSLISSQMAKQHVEMLKEMEEHAAEQRGASQAQLNAIRAQTAAQAASQAMNRALLERISESSADLAEQMHRQMREVHHLPV